MKNEYSTGHPWYYKLGGAVLKPKQIIIKVKENGYRGYMREEIQKADNKPEPQRSESLRKIRDQVFESCQNNLSIYRKVVCDLHRDRKENGIIQNDGNASNDIHMSMSLKHNHLYNDFAHIEYLNKLIAHQYDLFEV